MPNEPHPDGTPTRLHPSLSAADAGQLLRSRRLARGLTMDDVVARSEVPTRQYVQKLESGGVHPAKSKYLPSLIGVLGLTEADWANLTGQPRLAGLPDVLHPHRLTAATRLTEPVLPPLGAYTVELDPGVLILDTTDAMRVPVPGGTYVVRMSLPLPAGFPRHRLYARATCLAATAGEVLFAAHGHALRADQLTVEGRVLFEGHRLDIPQAPEGA